MGHLFSKPLLDTRKLLIDIDQKINKLEHKITNLYILRQNTSTYSTLIILLLTLIPPILIFYYPRYALVSILPLLIVFLARKIFLFFILKRIEKAEKTVSVLKEEQKIKVEELKRDSQFVETMSIIEKFESVGKKEKQAVAGGTSMIDLVSGVILGSDPTKKYALICVNCSSHNGLVHSSEFGLTKFVCFKCGFLNDKSLNKTEQ